jgi:hypoxanthine-DNA glycosylase
VIANRGTRLVVLGSFPGEASLQAQQYYGHPRNHFWPLWARCGAWTCWPCPTPSGWKSCASAGLGLWDVYASCQRQGSLDQAIREAQFNDLASLRQRRPACAWWRTTGANRRVP